MDSVYPQNELPYSFTVEEAMQDRFREGTTPRSEAYKKGFEKKLRQRIEGAEQPKCPFAWGIPEADAFCSGLDHAIEYLAVRKDAPLYD